MPQKNILSLEAKICGIRKKDFGDKTLTEFSMMKSKKDKADQWQTGFIPCKTWLNFPYSDKSKLTAHGYIDVEMWEKDGKKNQKIVFVVTSFEDVVEDIQYTDGKGNKVEPEQDLPF